MAPNGRKSNPTPILCLLLRVATPDKHGDRIDRFVLQEAQRTGKPFWGYEQGPLGSFTLRVAYPWVSNGEVIGYLEMGIEFEDIMQSIRDFLDVDVFVAANKTFFNRAKWDEAQTVREQPVSWDEFPNVLVLSRTTQEMPPPIAAYLAALGEQHSKRTFEIAWGGQVAQAIVAPFANLRGQEIGEIVVLRDITVATSEHRKSIFWVAALCSMIGGILMAFFYVLLGHVQRDFTDRKQAEMEIRTLNEELEVKVQERTEQLLASHILATTDSLTGIANRREFITVLEAEVDRVKRYGTPLSLAMYDLDHLKRVNDTFGHDVGDYVLQTSTGLVKENIRAVDVVARWGGEEFMVLMPQSDMQAARDSANRLRLAIAGHHFDKVGKLTASFGVATFEPQDDLTALLKRVDDALYRAKEQGRNRVEILPGNTE